MAMKDRVATYKRMEEIMHWIIRYNERHGHYPTQIEIASRFKVTRARAGQIFGELKRGGDIPTCPMCLKKRQMMIPMKKLS